MDELFAARLSDKHGGLALGRAVGYGALLLGWLALLLSLWAVTSGVAP